MCVIGGGVGGLSCARRLAQHGIETLLLEAGTVAGGASGRNGGFLIAGAAAFHNDAREQYGRRARRGRCTRTRSTRRRSSIALAEELGAGDARPAGRLLRLAVSEEEAAHVRDHAAALREDGFPAETVERDDLPPALQRTGSWAASPRTTAPCTRRAGTALLARAAEQAGARICEGTRGASARPGAGRGRGASRRAAASARGTSSSRPTARCRARPRVRGPRAHPPAAHGRHRAAAARARPARLRPLGLRVPPAAPRRAHPRGRLQRRGRRRLVHGQRRRQPRDLGARRGTTCARTSASSREITHRWAGVVGYSDDSLPYVGEVPGRDGPVRARAATRASATCPASCAGATSPTRSPASGREPLFPADREPWTGRGSREPDRRAAEQERERFAERTRASKDLLQARASARWRAA